MHTYIPPDSRTVTSLRMICHAFHAVFRPLTGHHGPHRENAQEIHVQGKACERISSPRAMPRQIKRRWRHVTVHSIFPSRMYSGYYISVPRLDKGCGHEPVLSRRFTPESYSCFRESSQSFFKTTSRVSPKC